VLFLSLRFLLSVGNSPLEGLGLFDRRYDLAKSRDDLRLCEFLERSDTVPRTADRLLYMSLKLAHVVIRMWQRVYLDDHTPQCSNNS